MPIIQLIGVTGYKRSGKDQFCTFLKEISHIPVQRHAFADDIRDEIYEHIFKPNGLSRELIYDDSKKDIYRPILIWWGTEFRRYHFGQNYWMDKMADVIRTYQDQPDDCIFCVSDVRLIEEAKFVRTYNGMMVKIDRFDAATINHPTETEVPLIEVDHVIRNRGTLDEYRIEVENFAREINLR